MVELIDMMRPDAKEDLTPKPLRDYVLLERERDMGTAGGLALPDSATQAFAKVVAVGPGRYEGGAFVAPVVKPGDRVLLDAPNGSIGQFYWGGREWVMTQECYLAAVLPGEKPTPAPAKSLVRPATAGEVGQLS